MIDTLVIGASGNVGSGVLQRLTQAGYRVKGATHQKQLRAGSKNLEWVYLDVNDPATFEGAFKGVDRAFLLAPPGNPNTDVILLPLIREAQARQLKKVVLMTAMGVDADDSIPFRKAELELEKSGLPFNILRPNWFMQNFSTYWADSIRKDHTLYLPAGDSKVSYIDTQDISDCAARLLIDDRHVNQAFNLTGPEALSVRDVAQKIAKIMRYEINYEDIAPDVFRGYMIRAGFSEDYAALMLNLFSNMRAGYASKITDDVRKITGHGPLDFEQFVHNHRMAWSDEAGMRQSA